MKNKSDKETFKLKKNPKRKKKEKDSNSSRDSLELTIKSYQENSKINQENMESGESIKFFFNEFPINKNKSSTATSNKRYQNNIKKEKEEFDFKELLLNYVNQTGRANDKKSKHDERGSIMKNEVLTLNGENNNTNNNDEFSNQISESSSENNMSKSKSLKSLSESSSEKKTEKEEINKKIKEKKKNKEKINKKITKNENNIKTVIKPKSNILINQKEKIKYNEEKLTPIKQVKIFTDKKMMNSEKNFTTATNTQDSSFKSLQLDFKKKNYDYLNFSDLSKKKKLIIQNRINSGKRNLKKEENSKEKDEKNIKIKNIGDNLFDKIRNLNISLEVEKSYSIYFSRIINLQNQKINSKNSTDKIQKDINKESKSTYSNYQINKRYYYYPDEYYIDKNSNLHSKSHVSNLFDKLRKKN